MRQVKEGGIVGRVAGGVDAGGVAGGSGDGVAAAAEAWGVGLGVGVGVTAVGVELQAARITTSTTGQMLRTTLQRPGPGAVTRSATDCGWDCEWGVWVGLGWRCAAREIYSLVP